MEVLRRSITAEALHLLTRPLPARLPRLLPAVEAVVAVEAAEAVAVAEEEAEAADNFTIRHIVIFPAD